MSELRQGIKDIGKRIEDETRDLRKASDWSDFSKRNGRIAGLEVAQDILRQRLSKSKEQGDDEDGE